MSPLLLILIVVFTTSAVLEFSLTALYLGKTSDAYKIYPAKPKKLERIARVVAPNSILSGAAVALMTLYGSRWFLAPVGPGGLSILDVLADAVLVLACYDLLYYLLHRYVFHESALLRSIHVLHHTVKYPTAVESLYVHPLENLLGLLTLFVSLILIGPISLPAFALILAVYSWLNVVIHSGLDFKHPLLRPIARMVRNHAKHHSSMRAGNYASITPIPDILFGTDE